MSNHQTAGYFQVSLGEGDRLQAGLLGIKVKTHCTKGADMANTRKGVNETCQR